jgi:hypothetical protein
MIAIRRELMLVLRRVIECDNEGRVLLSSVKTLREQLKRTIDSWMNLKRNTLADQIEWIYNYVDGFLFLLIEDSEKAQFQACNFRLGSEERNGIEKLTGIKE